MNNDLTTDESKTLDFYNKNAHTWFKELSVGSENLLFENELGEFRSLLGSGNIIEIGCGAGNDAKWFISNGYKYTGIDISPDMVALARSRVKNGNFHIMSAYNLDFPNDRFDGFWSSITLLHIPKHKLENALKEICRITKKGGVGFISMKEGVGEKYEDHKQRFYAYYSPEEFGDYLKNQGFDVISQTRKSLGKTGFLIFFVRKR